MYNQFNRIDKWAGLHSTARLKLQTKQNFFQYGLVQLGLMWRLVEPSFGIGIGRHINP